MLALNTVPIFNGIPENVNIYGNIIPDEGAWSIIQLRTRSSFVDPFLIFTGRLRRYRTGVVVLCRTSLSFVFKRF